LKRSSPPRPVRFSISLKLVTLATEPVSAPVTSHCVPRVGPTNVSLPAPPTIETSMGRIWSRVKVSPPPDRRERCSDTRADDAERLLVPVESQVDDDASSYDGSVNATTTESAFPVRAPVNAPLLYCNKAAAKAGSSDERTITSVPVPVTSVSDADGFANEKLLMASVKDRPAKLAFISPVLPGSASSTRRLRSKCR
jgi:hypothetical protein